MVGRVGSWLLIGVLCIAASLPGRADVIDSSMLPERLKSFFDEPWCKAWGTGCATCTKTADKIECVSDDKSFCPPSLKGTLNGYFHCKAYVVPDNCTQWIDGCNLCRKGEYAGCTAKACLNYKPSFRCVQTK